MRDFTTLLSVLPDLTSGALLSVELTTSTHTMPKPKKNTPPLNPHAMRAMMERALGSIGGTKKDTAEQRAQELVYNAMEATTGASAVDFLRQALDLDPENVDALVMMVDVVGLRGRDRIEALIGIVATGEKRLGKKMFKEGVPHFWGILETRPFMRAKNRLANTLREAGFLDEAAKQFEEMLVLNEGDNQGVRYILLPILLAQNHLDQARELMKRYPDECEWNVVFAWCLVLERRLSAETAEARDALTSAREQNGHVEAFITGHRKLPKNMPGSYSPGSKEEAICFADVLITAWQAHPEALTWLSENARGTAP